MLLPLPLPLPLLPLLVPVTILGDGTVLMLMPHCPPMVAALVDNNESSHQQHSTLWIIEIQRVAFVGTMERHRSGFTTPIHE